MSTMKNNSNEKNETMKKKNKNMKTENVQSGHAKELNHIKFNVVNAFLFSLFISDVVRYNDGKEKKFTFFIIWHSHLFLSLSYHPGPADTT